MQNRRDMMTRSAAGAMLLAAAGVLPARALSAWAKAAFEG